MNPLLRINALHALSAIESLAVIDQTGVGVDGDLVTIDGVIFELDDDSDLSDANNVSVDITTDTAANTMVVLAAAINANATLQAKGFVATKEINNSIEQCVVRAPAPFTATETLTNGTVVVITGVPASASDQSATIYTERVPTAAEVTSGAMHFGFAGAPSNVAIVAKVTATGARKYLTDLATIAGNRVVIATAGATTFAATDTVGVFATVSKTVK